MENCIFCKIASGQVPAHIAYQDELVTAFHDLHPQAPTHVLVIPNRHLTSVNHAAEADEALLGRLFSVARRVAELEGIALGGYRLVVNTGPDAGQSVFHIHMHVLGGRHLRWPPG